MTATAKRSVRDRSLAPVTSGRLHWAALSEPDARRLGRVRLLRKRLMRGKGRLWGLGGLWGGWGGGGGRRKGGGGHSAPSRGPWALRCPHVQPLPPSFSQKPELKPERVAAQKAIDGVLVPVIKKTPLMDGYLKTLF